MQLFKRGEAKPKTPVPAALKPENPVNYNSVLDYLVGLSQDEFDKIGKVTQIYREANTKTAEILGIRDQAISVLFPEQPTDEEIDAGLDTMLNDDIDFIGEEDDPVPAKKQAPSKNVKISVEDKK